QPSFSKNSRAPVCGFPIMKIDQRCCAYLCSHTSTPANSTDALAAATDHTNKGRLMATLLPITRFVRHSVGQTRECRKGLHSREVAGWDRRSGVSGNRTESSALIVVETPETG